MKNLFYQGGPFIMGVLSILLVIVIAWSVYYFLKGIKENSKGLEQTIKQLAKTKSIGLFTLITGIAFQLTGLYMAFTAIEKAADISPAIIITGIKMSLVAPLYGVFIFLLSILLWFVMDHILSKRI